MGKGIDLAAIDNPVHAQAIDDMKDQLLIVLVKKLGGQIMIPATEIDAAGEYNFSMMLDPETRIFTFSVGKKQ